MDGVAESREPHGTHRMRQLRLIDDADGPAVGLDPHAAHPLTVDQHRDSRRDPAEQAGGTAPCYPPLLLPVPSPGTAGVPPAFGGRAGETPAVPGRGLCLE